MNPRRLAAMLLAVPLLAPWPAGPAAGASGEPPSLLLERLLRNGAPASSGAAAALAQSCCKTCRAGKACGDSCIARDKTCSKAPGCACDARPAQ